jgi:hypothetical protein
LDRKPAEWLLFEIWVQKRAKRKRKEQAWALLAGS